MCLERIRQSSMIKHFAMKSLIDHELKALASPAQREVLMRFFKTGKGRYGEGDRFLGVKVPQTRAIVKKYAAACLLADIDKS